MTLEKTIFAVLILVCLSFAAITWEEFRADRANLEKAIATQQQIIDAAETREQTRDANLKTTLSQMAAANKSVQTPHQIVNALQQFLDLPTPLVLGPKPPMGQPKPQKGSRQPKIGGLSQVAPGPTSSKSRQDFDRAQASHPSSPDAAATDCCELTPAAPKQSVPANPNLKSEILDFFTRKSRLNSHNIMPQFDASSPPADFNQSSNPDNPALIPSADLKPLFDKIQACRSCEAQLAVSRADLSDEKTRSASLTTERDAALSSAKGGTFWHRLKQNAEWLAIGAVVAAVATRIR